MNAHNPDYGYVFKLLEMFAGQIACIVVLVAGLLMLDRWMSRRKIK